MTKEIYLLSVLLSVLLFLNEKKLKFLHPKMGIKNLLPEATNQQHIYIMFVTTITPYLNTLYLFEVVLGAFLYFLNNKLDNLNSFIDQITENIDETNRL